jgi:hypothetical protein
MKEKRGKDHIEHTQIKEIKLEPPRSIVMKDGRAYDFSEQLLPGEQFDEWLERCGKKREG